MIQVCIVLIPSCLRFPTGKHVVFGKVTEGLDILSKIEAKGSEMGRPQAEVKIVDCGIL